MDEEPLGAADDRDLRNESARVVEEIKPHVFVAEQSKPLESSYSVTHINICTKENIKLCVRLTVRGYEVVGDEFDTLNKEQPVTYELIDQLLNDLSPAYRESFGQALSAKLEELLTDN